MLTRTFIERVIYEKIVDTRKYKHDLESERKYEYKKR